MTVFSPTELEILRKARDLIADPKGYTTDGLAVNANGIVVHWASNEAAKYSFVGALRKIAAESPKAGAVTGAKIANTIMTKMTGRSDFSELYVASYSRILPMIDRYLQ